MSNWYIYDWWSMTADSNTSYKVFKIGSKVSSSDASSVAYLRPVLHLSGDAIYVSGDGSKENPYIIK